MICVVVVIVLCFDYSFGDFYGIVWFYKCYLLGDGRECVFFCCCYVYVVIDENIEVDKFVVLNYGE